MAADFYLDMKRKSIGFHVLMLFRNIKLLTIHFNTKLRVDNLGACLWRFLETYQLIENSPGETENLVCLDILLSGAFCI